MVYCGRPSKGCGMCRSRKISCDQGRPACNNCIRTKRKCPGYRDQLDLIFRDVTQSTALKAISYSSASSSTYTSPRNQGPSGKNSPTWNAAGSSSTTDCSKSFADTYDFNSDPEHQFFMRQLVPTSVATNPTPSLSKQEAICFFLQSHNIPGSAIMTDTLTSFLMDSATSLGQRAIQSSIYAVAGAMLARVRNVPSLRNGARQEYGNTLKLVNAALADPVQSRTNQTLSAVILMSLYEILTSRSPQGITGWTNHISGAAALLEHRGFGQLTNEMGVRLFLHLRYQIIISCLQRDVRVPDSLMNSSKLDLFPQLKETLGNKLILIIGNLSNLRADIHANPFINPHQVLSAASAIETELVSWLAALPPDFTYSSHTVMPMDHSFEQCCRGIRPFNNEYHSYPDIWSPSLWNHYRCARILVSEILLSHIHKVSNNSSHGFLSEDFRLHCRSLRATIHRLGADICRSVPFHLGACNSGVLPGRPMLPSESYLGGLMLLWPLFIAGIIEGPNSHQRLWVRQCLEMIGNTMGMDQALAMMDLLTVDPGIFHSSEIYGDEADREILPLGVLPISIFHVPYYKLDNLESYRGIRASSG